MHDNTTPSEVFFQQVIDLQTQLYAYILTLLADTAAADDVLQETNLVLCRKANEFVEGTNFEAWAFRIARLQCLAYWKIRARDRMVFSEEVLQRIASQAEKRMAHVDARTHALRQCLAKLPAWQRELLEARYTTGGSLKRLADDLRRSAASVSQSLYRIRIALLECVRSQLAKQEVPST